MSTRESSLTKRVYKKHLSLYRYLNNIYIFTQLMLPELSRIVDKFEKSSVKTKRRYSVPKKGKTITSRRTDQEIASLLSQQRKRGVFEGLLISVVSRAEAHLQECVRITIDEYPEKLKLLADDKSGIPLDLFLECDDKEEVLAAFIAAKCEGFLFLPPKKYIQKLEEILSIKVKESCAEDYLEIKASRDLVIHNSSIVNSTYLLKAGSKSRGNRGNELQVNEKYFRHVIDTVKEFAGSIMDGVEKKFK